MFLQINNHKPELVLVSTFNIEISTVLILDVKSIQINGCEVTVLQRDIISISMISGKIMPFPPPRTVSCCNPPPPPEIPKPCN